MMADIPSGYRVEITSWENDADNYRTQIFEGLSDREAQYIVDLAKLFRSLNRHDGGFGGSARHYKTHKKGTGDLVLDVAVAMNAVTVKFAAEVGKLRNKLANEFYIQMEGVDRDEWEDGFREKISELVGIPGEDYADETYFRVYDSHTVHYVEATVRDVTKLFK